MSKAIFPLEVINSLKSQDTRNFWIVDDGFVDSVTNYIKYWDDVLIIDCEGLTLFDQILKQISTVANLAGSEQWRLSRDVIQSKKWDVLLYLNLNLDVEELTRFSLFHDNFGCSHVVICSDKEPNSREITNYKARSFFYKGLTIITCDQNNEWISIDKEV